VPHPVQTLARVLLGSAAISGFALGADTIWSLAALAAGMHLHAYIPFESQPNRWSKADQALWHSLRARAHYEVLVGGADFDGKVLFARNEAMIRDCDLVVALLRSDVTKGGTFSAVQSTRRAREANAHARPGHPDD